MKKYTSLLIGLIPVIIGIIVHMTFLLDIWTFSGNYFSSFLFTLITALACGYFFGYQKGQPPHWLKIGLYVGGYFVIIIVLTWIELHFFPITKNRNGEVITDNSSVLFTTLKWAISILPILAALDKIIPDHEKSLRQYLVYIILLIGGLINPFIAFGLVIGYRIAYAQTLEKDGEDPRFHDMPLDLIFGVILGGISGLVVAEYLFPLIRDNFLAQLKQDIGFGRTDSTLEYISFFAYLVASVIAIVIFARWLRVKKLLTYERNRYGSARFARDKDLQHLKQITPFNYNHGLYIGGNEYIFNKPGHILTVAGTRSGKGVNLIIPNLLGKGNYDGSWVVVDPKGQNAFLSHEYQRDNEKRNVIILNPWEAYIDALGKSSCFNPLDLIRKPESPDLWDDCLLIAETIIPVTFDQNAHWNDRARTLLALTIAHVSTTQSKKSPLTLETVWKLLSEGIEFEDQTGMLGLFKAMMMNINEVNGEIIRAIATQFFDIHQKAEKEFASIQSTLLRHLNIIASPHLRKNTATSDFKIKDLIEDSNGNPSRFALYIVIPPEKLASHGRWLRLVITTLMRGIVRAKGSKKRITFLLDEFYSLGYLREIETGLSQYSGFNITLWPILQSISQLKQLYPKSWESFIDNSNVQHYFGINGEATMDYVSKLSGTYAYMNVNGFGAPADVTSRPLLTPDEVRRGSRNVLFTFIDSLPIAALGKYPYYEDKEFKELKDKEWVTRYPKNIPEELK